MIVAVLMVMERLVVRQQHEINVSISHTECPGPDKSGPGLFCFKQVNLP